LVSTCVAGYGRIRQRRAWSRVRNLLIAKQFPRRPPGVPLEPRLLDDFFHCRRISRLLIFLTPIAMECFNHRVAGSRPSLRLIFVKTFRSRAPANFSHLHAPMRSLANDDHVGLSLLDREESKMTLAPSRVRSVCNTKRVPNHDRNSCPLGWSAVAWAAATGSMV